MIMFCQPCDYIHKGRNVWFNPADVVTVKHAERYDRCIVTLKNGDKFTVDMSQEDAAKKINEALKEDSQ